MNRRRFFRVHANLRFTFAWDNGFELYRTIDLSASGAYVQRSEPSNALPTLGTRGECAFNLESMEIRAPAQVVRVVPNGFAVRFNSMTHAQEDRVCGWIFRQETRRVSPIGE